jgi:DNA polymerase-3 subunit delta'
MTLAELPIHKDLCSRLIRTVKEGRVAHGQYLQIEDGAGGLALALAYAQEILAGEPDMFGGVDTRASRLEHPDLHMIFPMVQAVDKTCDSSLEELRSALKLDSYLAYSQWLRIRGEKSKKAIISKHEAESVNKKLSLRSFEGGAKILIVWMAELMNQDCANKMLKLIEEPPVGSVIIMIGSDASRLLPTIRSRVQVTVADRLSVQEVAQALAQSLPATPESMLKAAAHAEGSIALAKDELQQEHSNQKPIIYDWLRLAYSRKVPEIMTWCDARAAGGKEELIQLIVEASSVIRIAFRKNYIEELSSGDDELDTFTSRFSPFVHDDNVSMLMEILDTAVGDLERNGNPRIVLLDTTYKLIRIIRLPRNEPA